MNSPWYKVSSMGIRFEIKYLVLSSKSYRELFISLLKLPQDTSTDISENFYIQFKSNKH